MKLARFSLFLWGCISFLSLGQSLDARGHKRATNDYLRGGGGGGLATLEVVLGGGGGRSVPPFEA